MMHARLFLYMDILLHASYKDVLLNLKKLKTVKCIQERGIDIRVKNKITPFLH
jgi:hypothetical protein